MIYKLNHKVIQQLESKILEHFEGDASIVEYNDEPYDVRDELLYYDYAVDLDANVISAVTVSGAQRDVDVFDPDKEYNIGCIVTGTTASSESASIAINPETGEIIVHEIKPAKFSEISNFEIDDTNGLDDASLYKDEIKDQDNWDEDYINDLVVKQFNFKLEPEQLFIK